MSQVTFGHVLRQEIKNVFECFTFYNYYFHPSIGEGAKGSHVFIHDWIRNWWRTFHIHNHHSWSHDKNVSMEEVEEKSTVLIA